MLSILKTPKLDTSFIDPEHDLDLVHMLANCRDEVQLAEVARICRARQRARRAR
ncbi:MAG: hypothetical protein ACP5H2_01030 [Solirubrobacteraceae bacterium]